MHSVFVILEYRHRLLHMRPFLAERNSVNRKFVKYTMDLLSVPEYVINMGRLHGHRYGKKPGDKEYHLANQLKKKCKKRDLQGIHDRFGPRSIRPDEAPAGLSLSSQRVRLMLIASTQRVCATKLLGSFFSHSVCLIVTSRPP